MGALEDYVREITSDNARRKQANALRSILPYPISDIAANAYVMDIPKDYAPGNAAPFRNDQAAIPLQNLPPQPLVNAPRSRVQSSERDPLLYPQQGTVTSDEKLQALSDKQRAVEQVKYLAQQKAADEAAAQAINAKESNAGVRATMRAPMAYVSEPGPVQGPLVPEIPAGWQPSTTGPEVLPKETLAALTPQERFAVAQGYTPELAQAVVAHDLRKPIVDQQVQGQETASPLIPELGETPQSVKQKRIVSMPSAVSSAYEQVLANAPKDLQPTFRAIREANTQKFQARREAASAVMQQVEAQRQEEHKQIDLGEQDAAEAGMLQYGAVQHEIQRDRAKADKSAELAKAHLSVQGLDKETSAEYLKQAREDINEKYKDKVIPFDSTPAYKNAMEAKSKMQDSIAKQKTLENQIGTLTDYLRKGEKQKAAEFARATVAQTVNSLSGPNAIQTTEMLIRYNSLLDASMKQELTHSWFGGSLATRLAQRIYTKEDADKVQQEVNKHPDKFANIIKGALESSPDIFLRTTVDTANSNAKALNSQLNELVVKPTSKKIAGVEYLNDKINPEVIPEFKKKSIFSNEAQSYIDQFKNQSNFSRP